MTTQSDKLDQLAAALVKAQQQVKGAVKDSTNPFFKSKYADLGSVWDACRDALTSNGLSVVQLPGYEPGAALLTTMLLHSSGQWIQGTAGAPLAGKVSRDGKESPADAQSVGSALTYLRRYALAAVAGVVQEDDDGESAVRRPAKAPQPLSEFPKQLTPEPDPFQTGEEPDTSGEIASPADVNRVFGEAFRAGIRRDTFGPWYEATLKRPYRAVLVEDVKPLLEAAGKRLALKAKVGEAAAK